jgi:hypothetical protein
MPTALPATPTGVRYSNGKLTWNAATPDIRSWTLYQQNGNTWALRQVLPATTTTAALLSGTYALCAVGRSTVESKGVVVKV